MQAANAAIPPNAKPQRAPAASANQPTMGTPTVVDPRKAIDQNDITRPRICGELSSCNRLLPIEEKLMEVIPTNTKAKPVSNKLGMNAAAKTAKPNNKEAVITLFG